ncbi:hypothetical protein CV945_16615 [Geobacillus sp. Manikaran-105]|nr:hypothetical protein CV945_16615 [Geobacillus sp. Manikaran-105]
MNQNIWSIDEFFDKLRVHANFPPWFGLVTFTIQENSHFLYPLCTPTLNDQVQLVVKSLFFNF